MIIVSQKLFILLLFIVKCFADSKLIFVQELFRHGPRYPLYPKQSDGTNYALEENKVGELISSGRKLAYGLGKKMRQTYWNVLFQDQQQVSLKNFYIQSTNFSRTIQSCQDYLQGLFDINQRTDSSSFKVLEFDSLTQEPEGSQNFTSIPIFVDKQKGNYTYPGDMLLAFTEFNCPRQKEWMLQNDDNQFIKQIHQNTQLKESLSELSAMVNQTVNFTNIKQYYDNYICTKYLQKPTLKIFQDPLHQRNLRYAFILNVYAHYLFTLQKQIKVTSKQFFSQTISNIKKVTQDKDILKWVVYSAHDITIADFLIAMNMTNVQCIYKSFLSNSDVPEQTDCIVQFPPFNANLVIQVYQKQHNVTNEVTFKINYMGKNRKIPFCNYQKQCPIEALYKWYDVNYHEINFMKDCGLKDLDIRIVATLAILEIVVLLGFSICIYEKYVSPSAREKKLKMKEKEQENQKQTQNKKKKRN